MDAQAIINSVGVPGHGLYAVVRERASYKQGLRYNSTGLAFTQPSIPVYTPCDDRQLPLVPVKVIHSPSLLQQYSTGFYSTIQLSPDALWRSLGGR
ncbi:hypothetical protein J6590_025515 [Homalodisca vitripennis]|nr:hypothetical protein J6590_025515 [Homalodisca vitripennis]